MLANWFEASGRRCFPIADGGVLSGLLPDYNMRVADLVVSCTGYTQEERAISEPLLRRNSDGSWPERPLAVTEGGLVLDSVGFSAPLAALCRTTRLAQDG